jgi:DNA-binding MarR family transcriptional regulator
MQWIILIYLRDGLASTSSEIAREFRHDTGALTRVIDQLERRGLLTRQRSTRDRRVVELALTARGRRTIESLLPVVVEQINAALAPFTRAEFEQLRDLMVRLVDHLQQTGGAAAPSPGAATRGQRRRRPSTAARSGRR